MKHSIRNLAALSLAALTALPMAARAEGMDEADMKVWRESVDERLKGLHNEVSEFNKVRMDFFSDIRADYVDSPNSNTGESGLYNRRAESKFYGMIQPNVTATLGFDFAELKLKDAGIQIDGLPLLVVMGPEVSVKLGQFRMPFGVETQTSSSATFFAERSFLNGGVGGTKLVGERAMGAQGKTGLKTGIVDFGFQAGAFNNTSQDQISGKNKLKDAFDKQDEDQDLSVVGRVGLKHAYLAGFLPEKSSLETGASYARDSQNTVWRAASNPTTVKYEQLLGLDLVFKLGSNFILQGEWVGRQAHAGTASGATIALRESYYGQMSYNILPFFSSDIAKGDKLELLFRTDQDLNMIAKGADRVANRLSAGIKHSYWGGKNHTALNYYVVAPDEQFGGTVAGGPSNMIVLQQQFAFESGKPKWMEKEAE